jgi:hypothetical protein
LQKAQGWGTRKVLKQKLKADSFLRSPAHKKTCARKSRAAPLGMTGKTERGNESWHIRRVAGRQQTGAIRTGRGWV